MSDSQIVLDINPRPSILVDIVTDGVADPEIVIKQTNAVTPDCFDLVHLTFGEFRQICRAVERNNSYVLSKQAAMDISNG